MPAPVRPLPPPAVATSATRRPKIDSTAAVPDAPVVIADFEFHAKLRAEQKLPEQQLERELTKCVETSQPPSPTLFASVASELPSMLTPSIVGVCEVCAKYGTMTRDVKPLWQALEAQVTKRQWNLTNEAIVTVLNAFSSVNKGSPELYEKMEVAILDTSVPFRPKQLVSLLSSYAQMNYGTAIFVSELSKFISYEAEIKIVDGVIANEPSLSLTDVARTAYKLSRLRNSVAGGYGLYSVLEKRLRAELAQNRLSLPELAKFVEYYFGANLGPSELQREVELEIVRRKVEMKITTFVRIVESLGKYVIKTEEFRTLLCDLAKMYMAELSDKQLSVLARTFAWKSAEMKTVLELVAEKVKSRAVAMRTRSLAELADGFCEVSVLAEKEKKGLFGEIEKAAMSKLRNFTVHDLMKLQRAFLVAGEGDYTLHAEVINEMRNRVEQFRYKDCIGFVRILSGFRSQWDQLVDRKLWSVFEEKLDSAADLCPVDDCADMLEICRDVNMHSKGFLKKLLGRLKGDAQGLSPAAFSKVYSLLVEFGETELPEYERIVRLLVGKSEAGKYGRFFTAGEMVKLLDAVLTQSPALFFEAMSDPVLSEFLMKVDDTVAYPNSYIRIMERAKTAGLVPGMLFDRYANVRAKMLHPPEKKNEPDSAEKEANSAEKLEKAVREAMLAKCPGYEVKAPYVDEELDTADIAVVPRDGKEGKRWAVLVFKQQRDYMAHALLKKYASVEARRSALEGKGVRVIEADEMKLGDEQYVQQKVVEMLNQKAA